MTVRTWQVEAAVVLAVLSATAIVSGCSDVEWIGVGAVWFSFMHGQISDRMVERQATRVRPDVDCYRMSPWYFIAKESLWFSYFVSHRSYAALVGCALFLVYPGWRRWWRARHPIALDVLEAPRSR